MEIPEILNVTIVEANLMHPGVFERFGALKQGSSFVIQNDHDPKPYINYHSLKYILL
jgi:regulator of cell morphogenesis and NO signaling